MLPYTVFVMFFKLYNLLYNQLNQLLLLHRFKSHFPGQPG